MTDAVTISRETLQAAVDALECALSDSRPYIVKSREVSTTLRAALAAQPAEPVAWLWRLNHSGKAFFMVADSTLREVLTDAFPVYAAPPDPAAVPLTVSEIERMWSDAIMNGADGAILFTRAVERAHGIAAGDKS